MGWRDRDYNKGRESLSAFMSDPGSVAYTSLPLLIRPELQIRVSFWFCIYFVFHTIDLLRVGKPGFLIPIDLAVMLGLLCLHEYGHRFFSHRVGGNHWEWVLWPLGGMIQPNVPRTPKAFFIANIGGILFTLPVAILAIAVLTSKYVGSFSWVIFYSPFNPVIVGAMPADATIPSLILAHEMAVLAQMSVAICVINLFPAYWFDGGNIWQAVLWKPLGQYRAINITCIAGIILSIPFILLSFYRTDFLGLVVWALILASCFNRRRELIAAGPGVLPEEDESYGYGGEYGNPDEQPARKRKRGWFGNRWAKAAAKRAEQDRKEQEQIDAILAKVSEKGLHSLTNSEKKALKRATEKQRQRDLADRP